MNKQEIKNRLLSDFEKLRSPKGYIKAGYPRYDILFGRDALITAWQMLDIDPEIGRITLQNLAELQGKSLNHKREEEPGKILHEASSMPESTPHWEWPYFGSIDSTPLFVVLAGKYFHKTADKQFLLQIWDNIAAAVNWMSAYGDTDSDHFLEYERKNPHGLVHQGWMDSAYNHIGTTMPTAIVEVQGYAYAAYLAAYDLSQQLGKDMSVASSWLEKAETLQDAFQEAFWWEEGSYYYLALDGNKTPKKSFSSNVGHLLFTGIIPDENIEKVVRRLFRRDLFTPYGIRTLCENDPGFDPFSYHSGSVWPHDNWMIYDGLKQRGFMDKVDQIKQALVSVYQKLGHIPELFAVRAGKIVSLSGDISERRPQKPYESVYANRLQAWATCGLLNMLWED